MRKHYFLFVLFFISTNVLFAQSIVNGIVKDSKDNSPISGATVHVKGSKTSAVTSTSGQFELKLKKGDVVEVSSISYLSKSFKFEGESSLSVNLVQDSKTMNELVVTGVGAATSKKKVALDVATLNMKETGKSSVASVEQALQGRIAGANIQFTSGLPGSSAQIYLRGINDLSGSGPIILVDGVEIKGGLTGLDFNAIERVEVVKGAAGGTLYGAQGANGVIQVFTKKGSRGKKPTITFQSQLISDQIIKGNDLVAKYHGYETDAEGYIINSDGDRMAPDVNNSWRDPVFLAANDAVNNKPYKEKIYDHIDQAYRSALSSNTTLNISGGGDNSDYALSLGYLNQQNVLFNGYKRVNLGSNLGFNLAKGLSLRSNTSLIYTNEDLLAGGNRFNLTNSWRYIDFTALDSKGYTVVKPKDNENQLNPLSEREWRTRGSKSVRVLQNANLNYKVNRFLELDYKYGIEYTNSDYNDYYKNQNIAPQSADAYWGSTVDGSITNTFINSIYQNSLTSAYLKFDFAKDFNLNIPINSVTQFSYDWRHLQNNQYFAQGSILPSYPPYNINVASTKTSGDYRDKFITYGALINQSFDYANLFGLSLGLRSDYSSEFGEATKPQQFLRGAFYFRPTELIKSNSIPEWKIRLAYGQAGIQPYTFLPYARQLVYDVSTVGVGGVGISSPSQNRNPGLELSTSDELEVGTDFTVVTGAGKWMNKLNFSASYWNRKVKKSYQYADNSPSTGFSQAVDNLTDLSSKGFDFSVDADVFQNKNISWNSSIRVAQFKVFADKISNGADVITGIFALKEGEQLGSFYAQTPLTSVTQVKPNGTSYIAESDRANYEIVNGMVVNTLTKKAVLTSPDDQSIVGSAYPKFNLSFINNVNFCKNFNLAFQFDWRYGNKIYNLTRQWLYRDRLSADYDKEVTIGGSSGAYVNYYNSLYNNVSPNSWFVESGSVLRLRDISLSYNLDTKYLPKVFKSASLTFAARNLLTVTDYSGLDPESTNTSDAQGNSASTVGVINGVDYFGVPNLKSYLLSLNVSF